MLLRNSKSFKRCYPSFTGLKRVVVFEGDGIGPEIVGAARKCIDAALVSQNSSPIQWLERDAGSPGLANLSEDDLEAFDDTKLMFKGPLTIKPGQKSWVDLRGRKFSSSNQVFRKIFELYANIRPSKSYAGVDTPFKNVDWVVFRENTEDVYTGEETVFNAGQETEYVEGVKRNSRLASRRIAQRAAEFAVYNDRRHITVLHKANVCKLGDGLWLSETLATARAAVETAGSSVGVDDQLADSFLCNAVQHPHHFDIILCPNLIGDFVSDMAGGLIGSLGLCGSANVGDNHALFEAAHGSAPDIAGQSKANPISMTLSGALLLRQIGEIGAANSLEKAIEKTVANKNTTSDLGGNRTTNDCAQAIIDSLE